MNAVNNTYVKVLKYILFAWQVLISDCLSNRTTVIHISYCLSRSTLKERGKFTSVIVCLVSRANRTNGHLSLLLSRFTLIERGTFKFLNELSCVTLEEREKITFLLPLMRHANRKRQVHDFSAPRALSKILIVSKYQDWQDNIVVSKYHIFHDNIMIISKYQNWLDIIVISKYQILMIISW